MPTFWMSESRSVGIFGSDAFNRNQIVCREAFGSDRARRVLRRLDTRRPLEVLIVDDDQDATDGTARLVRGWGHRPRVAYNGAGALQVAAAQHPDTVLLDIAMPQMSGYEVARQLRRDFPSKDCFLIAVTGNGNGEAREQCLEAGIDLVLIKPVQPAVLEMLLMLESERMNRLARGRQNVNPRI